MYGLEILERLKRRERKAITNMISLINGIKDSTKFAEFKRDNVILKINVKIIQLIVLLTTKSFLFKKKLIE